MSLQAHRATDQTITGVVTGVDGSLDGWVLSLAGEGVGANLQKSSSDSQEIAITDSAAREFAIYLTPEDTAVVRDFFVEMRGVDPAGKTHVLERAVLEILP